DRRHAVPAREREVRVPEELRIVVRVEIDEAGRDDHPLRVEDALAIAGAEPADARDATVPDADVGLVALRLRAVDDDPTPQDDVEVRHRLLSRGALPPDRKSTRLNSSH